MRILTLLCAVTLLLLIACLIGLTTCTGDTSLADHNRMFPPGNDDQADDGNDQPDNGVDPSGDYSGPINGVLGGKPATLIHPELFSADSVWNTPIPDNPEIDPNSEAMVAAMDKTLVDNDFVVSPRIWTNPVYYADETTPRYDIKLVNDWEVADWLLDVPVPDWAEPDPEDDGQFIVFDLENRIEYDFWQAKKINGQWQASWANAISLDSDGSWPRGMSCRGSGFALAAGVIWPDELEAGVIDHALGFIYDWNRTGGPVWPATESDGDRNAADAIPEGARIQLDPALDLDTLNLAPYQRTIAECLQKYGMIDIDNGGGMSFQGVSWISVTGDPWEGLLPDLTYPTLIDIPLESFRVLKLGPQIPEPDLGVDNNGVAQFLGIHEE